MIGRRDPVVLAWVLGLGLAAVAYAVGPQHFLFQLDDWLHTTMWRISEAIGNLSLVARDMVRALAIGIYGTFVVLAIAVMRRGGPAKAALFWITILFLLLIGRAEMITESNGRWAMALLVALFGAMTMTNRLRSARLVPSRP